MKALFALRYGGPEVLEIREVETPAPEAGRVLVRVRAASVNPADYHGFRGGIARLFTGLLRPKDPRIGTDVAGTVESVGPGVTRFKAGDEVFGAAPGALAELAVAREDRLAPKPPNVSYEEAGAVGIAGATALQGLRDKGRLKAGQSVLVNGASGGVGTFAVQIAKALGAAEVTGVCSPKNLETARLIGADRVIDYTRDDFTRDGRRYDVIYDIVGNHTVSEYKRALNPGGACLVAGVGFPSVSMARLLRFLIAAPVRSKVGDKRVGFMGVARLNDKDLGVLGEFLATGKVRPVIDRTYRLDKAADAMRYLGEGHARGKVVVTVGQDGRAA